MSGAFRCRRFKAALKWDEMGRRVGNVVLLIGQSCPKAHKIRQSVLGLAEGDELVIDDEYPAYECEAGMIGSR